MAYTHLYFIILSFTVFKANALEYVFVNYTMQIGNAIENNCSCPIGHRVDHYVFLGVDNQLFKGGFKNPFPEGCLFQTANITLTMSVLCGDDDTVVFELVFAKAVVVDNYTVNVQCVNCSSCMQDVVIPFLFGPGEWPFFDYQGINYVEITLQSGRFAISDITLHMMAVDLNPEITQVTPTLSPTTTTDLGTKVFITAKNFVTVYFTYKCVWHLNGSNTTLSTQAYPMPDSNTVYCPILTISQNQTAELYVSPDILWFNLQFAKNSTGPIPFYFYDQPEINSFLPVQGRQAGGTIISIIGEGFFNHSNAILACKFNDLGYGSANYINSTYITCVSPNCSQPIPVILQISFNNNSFITVGNYHFLPSALPYMNLQYGQFFWIEVASIAGLISMVILLAIYLVIQKYLKRDYEDLSATTLSGSYLVDVADITFKEIIGRGSFGYVYRGIWRYTDVAIKKLNHINDSMIGELYREAELMTTLRHPNIVTFLACTTKPDVCLITEYIERGSLYNIIHNDSIKLEIGHIRRLALDACKGMDYLHGIRIIHRDLKSHNLLVDRTWVVKVADFGLSRAVDDINNKTMTACGTPCWTAPEIIRNQRYTFKADVYSFGICLWEMLSRKDPYPGMPPYQVVLAVAGQNLRPTVDLSWPSAFRSILEFSWDDDPEKRPTFRELIENFIQMDLPEASSFPE